MHQYLLTVAEKIIYKSAPIDIIKKYEELKKSISHKADIDQIRNSNILTNSKKHNISSSAAILQLNSNIKARSYSKSGKKQNICQIDNQLMRIDERNNLNMNNKIIRAQSRCSSTAPKSRNSNYEGTFAVTANKNIRKQEKAQSYELKCIQQLTLLLKNAQNCPRMLINIQLPQDCETQQSLKVRRLFEKIKNSLKVIFLKAQSLFKQQSSQKQVQKIEVRLPKQIPKLQMAEDNKWLIDKMEVIMEENIVMRKMLGKNVID